MMAKHIRIMVMEDVTKFNIVLPIGLVARLLRFSGDLANVFAKQRLQVKVGIEVKDFKVLAEFMDSIKDFEPFTMVEIEDGKSRVLIRTE